MTTELRPNDLVHDQEVATRNARSAAGPNAWDPPRSATWWKRGLFAVFLLAAIGIAAPFVVRSIKPKETGPKLTHTIARSDLMVTVTEQGTLESSNNTEIKCKVRGSATVLWVIEAGTLVEPGDELVKLDPSTIEDNISEQKIVYETALANKIIGESDVAIADTNITEYLESTFLEEKATIENEIFVAEQDLKRAQLSFESVKRLVARGLLSSLQLEGEAFAVESARKTLGLAKKRLAALEKYTKEKNLIELRNTLRAAEARLAAHTASLDLEKARLDREELQLQNCVILAESSGMVIHPSAAEWKERPDIEEGATVRQDQVLLMIPDLSKMQVKVGIHESKIERIKAGMPARIELQDVTIEGKVASVASVTRPAGWWTGNVVKYDTIIDVDYREGLKPGMSAEVEVIIAQHDNALTIPVAAVVEQGEEFLCWVKTADGIRKRVLQLGDSDDQFIVIASGLKEGDQVVLNPIAFVEEAQNEALKPFDETKVEKPDPHKPADDSQPRKSAKPADETKPEPSKPKSPKPQQPESKPDLTGDQLVKRADKNGDGVLTKDEFGEKDRSKFDSIDSNQDGKVDAGELDATLKAGT